MAYIFSIPMTFLLLSTYFSMLVTSQPFSQASAPSSSSSSSSPSPSFLPSGNSTTFSQPSSPPPQVPQQSSSPQTPTPPSSKTPTPPSPQTSTPSSQAATTSPPSPPTVASSPPSAPKLTPPASLGLNVIICLSSGVPLPTRACCQVLKQLSTSEAVASLCSVIPPKVLGNKIDISREVGVLLKICGVKSPPDGFTCPGGNTP